VGYLSYDWISFHGLMGDPFSTTPLKSDLDFQRLFVKTKEVSEFVDPIVSHFVTSRANFTVIGGTRGIGKSTVLHYLHYMLSNKDGVLSVYTTQQTERIERQLNPNYHIGYDTLYQIMNNVLLSLSYKFPDCVKKHSSKLNKVAEAVGFDLSERTGVNHAESSFGVLSERLRILCEVLKSEDIKTFVTIDNYDRHSEDIAIKFLEGEFAQPVFEILQDAGMSITMTVDQLWITVT